MAKKDQWKAWVELYEANQTTYEKLYEFIDRVPEKYRKIVALALAVCKWRPESSPVGKRCAACDFYESCADCPVNKSRRNICGRLHDNWGYATTSDDERHWQSKIYKALLELYKEEYKRLPL